MGSFSWNKADKGTNIEKIKFFIYYLFNDKIKNNCMCDIDCECEFHYQVEQKKLMEKWWSKYVI